MPTLPPPARSGPRPLDGGLSLLELVVALAVLSIVLAGLMRLGSTSVRSDVRSRDFAAATSLVVEKLESFKATPFEAIAAGNGEEEVSLSSAGDEGGIFRRAWSVADESLAVSGTTVAAKAIRVAVTWDGGGRAEATTRLVDPGAINTSAFGPLFPTVAETAWRQVR